MNPAIGSSQNQSAFRRGNAMSGAPIISGITKFASPAKVGMTNRKIISAAWTENSPLKVWLSTNCMPGWASSARMIIASRPADQEEEERGDHVLDADHLVIGVDAEVVLPAARAVAGVVLRLRRLAEHVVHPVVEAAESRRGSREARRSGSRRQ